MTLKVLVDRFAWHIRGEDVPPYPTFTHGSLYQSIIDVLRRSDTWVDVTRPN